MAEKLKDLFFTKTFISELGEAIQRAYPGFAQKEFYRLVSEADWEDKELKDKMHHITECMMVTLPENYEDALNILMEVAPRFKGFDAMIFPNYVERKGLDDWKLSMPALARFTRLCSAEFAIRPFLVKDPERTMQYMYEWASDEDVHLRRLASEGCRPRLPWARTLPAFIEDPAAILPILEALKDDPEEYVRKSVANNLNDISKDHPDLVLDICERWYGQTVITDWIVKRACRTLLKGGNTRALVLFGFKDPGDIKVKNLKFDRSSLIIGDELQFSFEVSLPGPGMCLIRLEYGVDYVRYSNKISRKIFQIREAVFEAGSHFIARKHSFKDLSTRRHYPGQHRFTIIVNGVGKSTGSIELIQEP